MSRFTHHPLSLLVTGLLATAPAPGQEAAIIGVARKLHSAAGPVVSVGAAVRVKLGPLGTQEFESKTIGVALDAAGLILVSRSALNPHGDERQTIEVAVGEDATIEAKITSTWIQRPGGRRIEAEIVLSAPELDVSLLRPRKDAGGNEPFAAVDLVRNAPKAAVLDEVIVLSRLGEEAGSAPSVHIARISAALESPWPGYVTEASLGDAVFAADGRLLGIVVALPRIDGRVGDDQKIEFALGRGGRPAVLPVAQFRELVARAGSKHGAGENGGTQTPKRVDKD